MRMTALALLLVGCTAVAPEVEKGSRAARLVQQAGGVKYFRPPKQGGNALWISDNALLTANHLFPDEDHDVYEIFVDDEPIIVVITDRGEDDEAGDWALLRPHRSFDGAAVPSFPLDRRKVEIGEEVLVVGYWNAETSTPRVDEVYPVLLQGHVREWTCPFGADLEGRICIDVGPGSVALRGLSGSAVLARQPEGGQWAVIGLMGGSISCVPWGGSASFFIPIPAAAMDQGTWKGVGAATPER